MKSGDSGLGLPVEQLGPEMADVGVHFVRAGHVAASQCAHAAGAVEVIENPMLAEERIEQCRAVAGGVDAGDAGLAVCVGQDGLFSGDGRAAEKFLARQRPHGGNRKIARQHALIGQYHALHAAITFEPQRRAIGMNRNLVLLEETAGPARGGFAGKARPRVLTLDQQINLEAHLRERGGKLQTEQARADDGDATAVGTRTRARMRPPLGLGFVDCVVQALQIVERAQVVQAGQIMARDRQVFRISARRQEELVERNLIAIVQDDGLAGRVEMRGATAGAQLDAVLGIPTGRLGEEGGAGLAVAQRLFRQRRATIGPGRFLGDQEHFALGVALADRFRGGTAGHAAADQEVFHVVFGHGADNYSRSLYLVGMSGVQGGKFGGAKFVDPCGNQRVRQT